MKFSELPLHHAVLVTNENRQKYADNLWSQLSALSPAHRYFNQTVLDIETARTIISWAQSSYTGDRVALISFHTAGLPAQNAMLKILEEPRNSVRFILVTTHKNNVIDTILSRVQHVPLHDEGDQEEARAFLETKQGMRMKLPLIVDILARIDEEGRKDRESVKAFILSLIPLLQKEKAGSRYIEETLKIASYASDPSASGKALLEYLSLLLPVVK